MFKPKVLVLGASGMLGARVREELNGSGVEVHVLASRKEGGPDLTLLDRESLSGLVDGMAYVINCVGVTDKSAPVDLHIAANAMFPHDLQRACSNTGAKLIHISTDCVYSGQGRWGVPANVTVGSNAPWPPPVKKPEEVTGDAHDVYGMTKLLGEPAGAMVLRTSFIGQGERGLLQWFMGATGEVRGYTCAWWSGMTARNVARVIARIVARGAWAPGVWNLAMPEPVSKYVLLQELEAVLPKPGRTLIPLDAPFIDRSLDGSKLRAHLGLKIPDLWEQIAELAKEVREVRP